MAPLSSSINVQKGPDPIWTLMIDPSNHVAANVQKGPGPIRTSITATACACAWAWLSPLLVEVAASAPYAVDLERLVLQERPVAQEREGVLVSRDWLQGLVL